MQGADPRSAGSPPSRVPPPIRRRALRPALVASLLAVLVAWPGSAGEPSPLPTDVPPTATPTATPTAATPGPVALPGPDAPPGLDLRLQLDRSAAASGEVVTATAVLANDGTSPVRLRCARPIELWADISNMMEGPRATWSRSDPWRRGMRRALLGDPRTGTGPMALPLSPTETPDCPRRALTLDPGASITVSAPWTVGHADGSPLSGPDGDPVVIRARTVPLEARSGSAAGEAPPAVAAAMALSVRSARGRGTLSPARAIEALFEDPAAAAWLDLEHSSTWRRAGMTLARGQWRFKVRRVATGCCRETLAARLDARSGRMLSLDAPTISWAPARTEFAFFETLQLRLDLQRRHFRDGRSTRMRVTVTNLDDEDSVWFWSHDNACVDQPGLWIAAGPDAYGRRWRGKLGEFKRLALRSDVIVSQAGAPSRRRCRQPAPLELGPLASVTTESFFRPDLVPTGQRTLQAIGRIDLVGPSPDTVRAWRVYASPTVRARFRVGDGSQQMLSPSLLIDAALSDRSFARAIRRIPTSRWRAAGVTGGSVWLELTNGRRIVGIP